jgi:hypothetical protein
MLKDTAYFLCRGFAKPINRIWYFLTFETRRGRAAGLEVPLRGTGSNVDQYLAFPSGRAMPPP